ncbi:deoxyribodipyrimidine photo-lyase [Povalibacter sp.]|uniref:cryptochrome/photolyase family protein n=1 Tax=Povalibacter sp. TaxID=1962978 RepID=UPI002F3E5FBF
MTSHRLALVWLRRDLRLADNPALAYALANAGQILPVFIHSPQDEGTWAPGAASNWWLHHSLTALESQLLDRGSRMIVRRGAALSVLPQLVRESGATLVTWNRLYEPAIVARDAAIKTRLAQNDIDVESHNAALLFEPWTIRNGQQLPYRVFTPFWRSALTQIDRLPAPQPAPRRLATTSNKLDSLTIADLALLPDIHWDEGIAQHWEPGEAGAHRQLERFAKAASDYAHARDRPDLTGTSSLSPHLHFGEIGPRQIFARLHLQAASSNSLATYAKELGWREFAHHLLFHFPHTTDKPLDTRFEHWQWGRSKSLLRAWQRGMTGYPLVDAGMRELWHRGWMHNRVRMIAASFLTKNLQIHWLQGARWFWDTLVDADLASNTLGWQWTAGCGADAAPYYRIFNPVLQAEKFDPQRAYIRQWLPELATLPDKWIHRPWEAPDDLLSRAGIVLGKTYPRPVIDLRQSRDDALTAYQVMKQSSDSP